ncbi:DUF2817 domain-containing protein [Myxococcota bacterium]|nr:DUF2817 domain-containing protein [Myxococcota bacterium]
MNEAARRAGLALSLMGIMLGCGDDDEAPRAGDAEIEATAQSSWAPGGWIIDYSVEGRPIIAEQYGLGGPVLLLISAIHGDERAAVTYGERARAALLAGLAERAGVRVIFIGAANPDGIARETRRNARGVDINRNFAAQNFGEGDGEGGRAPLSEPESRALTAILDRAAPAAVISVHCCVPTMDYDGPGQGLAEVMAAAMGEAARFPVERYGSMPGSMGSLVGIDRGIAMVTVEFALSEIIAVDLQLDGVARAVEAAADWIAQRASAPEIDGLEIIQAPGAPLETLTGRSAGGLTLRAERLGDASGPPTLLLSGLIDGDRRAAEVAEHLRRALIHEIPQPAPLLMVTQANPDGAQTGSGRNADGVEVAEDFISGARTSPEAAFLAERLRISPGLVIHVIADEVDSVATWGIEGLEPPARLLDRGRPSDPVSRAFIEAGAAVVVFGVHGAWARGDDQEGDASPRRDPALFSALARRALTSEAHCIGDGRCDVACRVDPDCDCACDYHARVCEPAARGVVTVCGCDPDCADGAAACVAEGHCDTWCPAGADPDC